MKPTLFDRILWVINCFALVGLLLSYLAVYISPAQIWWLALFGLGFGIMVLVNLFYVIYWIIRKKKKFWYSLILLIAGFGQLGNLFHLNFDNQESEQIHRSKGRLKIMTFNVRLFNLYNWFHNDETRSRIYAFLAKESPDVICIQEFYTSERKVQNFNTIDTLRKILAADVNVEYSVTLHEGDHFGIATFSKYPIINKHAFHFQKKGGDLYTYSDIAAGRDTIRIFNTHLQSIHFNWQDYKFIENIGNDEVNQDEIEGSLNILRRLKRAFIKRAKQVKIFHEALDESPYPLIVCGDFNDTPSSFTYRILLDDLKDAFRVSGNGFGKTYVGPFPSYRIDYIYHDPRIKSFGYQTHKEILSDHYPVSCFVQLPQ